MSGPKCTIFLPLHIIAILTNVRIAKPGIRWPGDEGQFEDKRWWRNTFIRVYSVLCCENGLVALSISSYPYFPQLFRREGDGYMDCRKADSFVYSPGSTWGAERLFSQIAKKWMAGTCRMVLCNGGKGETQRRKPFNPNRAGMAAEEHCSPWATVMGWVAAGGRCHSKFLSASLLIDNGTWSHYCH